MADINIIPGEKLVIKIWESLVDKGIGSLLAPGQIRREGKARTEVRRQEMLVLAQAENDAKDILAGRKALNDAGQLVALPTSSGDLPALTAQHPQKLLHDAAAKFAARQVKREINLKRIAIHAEEQAQHVPDNEVSDHPIGDDWLDRWRENAQDVSDDHMQRVWARILAEEVKTPGSYAMGTLEFLRTLSKADALKIAKIGPYILVGSQIYRDQPFLDGRGVSFDLLLELQEMGILSGVEAIGLSWSVGSAARDNFQNAILSYGKVLYLNRDTKEPPPQITVYRVTKLGREILRLGDYKPDDEYLRHVGLHFKSQGFKVRYGDWISVDATTGRVANAIEL